MTDNNSPQSAPDANSATTRNPLKRLYRWTEGWAERPGSARALFALSFAESSFFPIPPDVLLLALGIGKPKRAVWLAFICTLGSVLGGIFGYAIGFFLFEFIGRSILQFYGAMPHYETIKNLYHDYDAWAVAIAGFTPIPYKVFTIAAGACAINFKVFVLASIASRGARFFLEGFALYFWGPKVKPLLERYFNLFAILFVVLLIGGFALLKLWI